MKTKKQIYAEHGIEYNPKNAHITLPSGETCKELLKTGNSKTGKKVLTWSMNQTTCACHCVGCYADAGFYRRANVIASMRRNTELARNNLTWLEECLTAQLETCKDGTEIRIHAVGDFFNREYVNMWVRIVSRFPSLYFWTYTKTEYGNAFDGIANANIVKSIIDGEYNFGHCDHVMRLFASLTAKGESVHICKCGFDDSQHCEGCHKCSTSKYVLFLEHSTAYDGKNDPLYDDLYEMVMNQ